MTKSTLEAISKVDEIATDNVPSRELSPITEAVDQWTTLAALVLDAVTSPHSRRAYSKALEGFFEWWSSEGRPPVKGGVKVSHHGGAKGDH